MLCSSGDGDGDGDGGGGGGGLARGFTKGKRSLHHTTGNHSSCVFVREGHSGAELAEEDTVTADEHEDEVEPDDGAEAAHPSVRLDAVVHDLIPILAGENLEKKKRAQNELVRTVRQLTWNTVSKDW